MTNKKTSKKKTTAKSKAGKTTKKSTATKKKRNVNRGPNQKDHVSMLVRIHPDTKLWCEEMAEHHGLSRDGFCRMLFDTARASWNAYDEEAQMRMFAEIQSHLEEVVHRAIREVVEQSPRTRIESKFGGITRPPKK